MKTKSLLLAVSILSPFQVFAADETVCTKGKLERRVAVVGTDGQPCEVRYFKDDDTEGKVLWNAKSKLDYCNTKAQEFVQKLSSFGWTCKGSIKTATQATAKNAPETPITPTDAKLKEEKKKKKEAHRKNPKADTEAPADATAPAAEVKN